MFLLTDIPNVRNHLQNKLQTCSEKINVLEVSLLILQAFFIYMINVATDHFVVSVGSVSLLFQFGMSRGPHTNSGYCTLY